MSQSNPSSRQVGQRVTTKQDILVTHPSRERRTIPSGTVGTIIAVKSTDAGTEVIRVQWDAPDSPVTRFGREGFEKVLQETNE